MGNGGDHLSILDRVRCASHAGAAFVASSIAVTIGTVLSSQHAEALRTPAQLSTILRYSSVTTTEASSLIGIILLKKETP